MSSCWPSQLDRRYSWTLRKTEWIHDAAPSVQPAAVELNAPVERRSSEALFDDVAGQPQGGTCGDAQTLVSSDVRMQHVKPRGHAAGAARPLSPMARSACCSSRVNVVRGTSSDTGRTATVDRLDAWLPASH